MCRWPAALVLAAVAFAQSEIIVGTSTQGYAATGSYIYYAFQWANAPNYTVAVERVSASGDPDLYVTLNTVYSSPWTAALLYSSAGGNFVDSVTVTPTAFGLSSFTYGTWIYVTVKGYSTCSYRLNVTGAGLPPGPVPTPSASPIPNQWINYPTLQFGTTIMANITQGASDYYRFVMPYAAYFVQAALGIRVNFTGGAGNASDVDLYAALEGPTANNTWAPATGMSSTNPASYGFDELLIASYSPIWPTTAASLFIRVAGVGSFTSYSIAISTVSIVPSATPSPGAYLTSATSTPTPGYVTPLGALQSVVSSSLAYDTKIFVFYAPYAQTGYTFTVSARKSVSTASTTTYSMSVGQTLPPCAGCSANYAYTAYSGYLQFLTYASLSVTTQPSETPYASTAWYVVLTQTGGTTGISLTITTDVSTTSGSSASSTPAATGFAVQPVANYVNTVGGTYTPEQGVGFTVPISYGTNAYLSWHPYSFMRYNASAAWGTWVISISPIGGDVDLGVSDYSPTCSSCFTAQYSSSAGGTTNDTVRVYVHSGNYNQQWGIQLRPFSGGATGAYVSIYRASPGNGAPPAGYTPSTSKVGAAIGGTFGSLFFFAIVAVIIIVVIKNGKRTAAAKMASSEPGIMIVAMPGAAPQPAAPAPMLVTNPVPIHVGGTTGGNAYGQQPGTPAYIPGEMPPAGFQMSNPQFRPMPGQRMSVVGGQAQMGGVPTATYGSSVPTQQYGVQPMAQMQPMQGGYGMPMMPQQGYPVAQPMMMPTVGYGTPAGVASTQQYAQPQAYASAPAPGMQLPGQAPTSFAPQPLGGSVSSAPPAYSATAQPAAIAAPLGSTAYGYQQPIVVQAAQGVQVTTIRL